MKKYKNINYRNKTIINKIKSILIFLGLKKIINKFIFIILSIILKTKKTFIKEIIFDFYKEITEIIFFDNKHGEKFVLFTNDNIISKQVFISGEFDLGKLSKVINFLNNSKKIENLYDVGANIGTICIPAVKRNLVKKAFAVEPVRKNFDLLKINLILNNLEEKIMVYNKALNFEDDQSLEMELAHDNSGDHRVRLKNLQSNLYDEESRKTEIVKSKKFDTLFKNLDYKKDLVWIDTQGFEPLILAGAQELIKSKTAIVVEFWPYGLKRNNLWNKMKEILKNFNFYADLSEKEIILKNINKESLEELFSNWDQEEKGKHALFTDLLLLQENL